MARRPVAGRPILQSRVADVEVLGHDHVAAGKGLHRCAHLPFARRGWVLVAVGGDSSVEREPSRGADVPTMASLTRDALAVGTNPRAECSMLEISRRLPSGAALQSSVLLDG